MKPKKIPNNIHLTSEDVDALLCALPLVSIPDADTPEQTELNRFSCETVATKMASHIHSYSANELRVISVAIEFALDIIRGTGNEFISISDVSPELRRELSGHFFTYNRLKPGFDDLISQIKGNV